MNLSTSLEALLPIYETLLPFSKEKVSFTPFRVKDAKNISIVLQENNKKLALIAMLELLKTNAKNVNVNNLCLADAEYLFLQIRSKSVDELLNLIYNKERIQVYIPDIKGRNQIKDQVIQLNNNTYLTLETPTIKDLLKLESLEKEDLIKACIKKVTVNGEIFHTNKFVTEEITNLLQNLPLNILPKFDEFIKNQPELFVMMKTQEGEKEVSGFLNFFSYR